ncbi:MAG: YdcF family protein [Clostridia bacterium]|nr:YdcF family protein [Clostridia bacterium]MBQ6707821.1 YdcF family protein [Clostridia bacterium]
MRNKAFRICLIVAFCLMIAGAGSLLGINLYVKSVGGSRLITPQEASELEGVDCIMVLGCQVHDNEYPSDMLEDRLNKGIEVYNIGASPKLLMSGDHGQHEYDEVNVMKQYAVDTGISSSDVFMDHAGFSTYESVYRAKEIFGADKIIIVTQEYHLYRALYIANKLGVEAYGVAADYRPYAGKLAQDCREALARVKDFATTIIKPEPTFLGEAIPVNGDGNITND